MGSATQESQKEGWGSIGNSEDLQYKPYRNGNNALDHTSPTERLPTSGSAMEISPQKTPGALSRDRMSPDLQKNVARRPSGAKRICGKCGGSLSGQFVRALDDTFHLECFTCHVGYPRKLHEILLYTDNRG